MSAAATASANRYGASGLRGITSSYAVLGELTFRVRIANPNVSLSYLLDTEYLGTPKHTFAADGRPYSTLFLTSREVHAPGAIMGAVLTEHLRMDALAGYSWDRLGGAAPYFGAHLHYSLPRGLLARVWLERRLYRLDTALAETTWGAHIFGGFD